ncbi:MAG: chemotaxis protein CheA [Rhodobacteraceae bacterium]|nr:chemotaxis protein CheA [Paracoccaceae bacterium]
MSDPMQEIRASFFIECDELLEALLDGLEAMSNGGGDGETVNVVFRAVHSIKGGAGAFGLDQLVEFAHAFESAMDAVRAGQIVVDDHHIALFFQGGDTLADLVRHSREGTELDPSSYAELRAKLDAMSAEVADAPSAPSADPAGDGFAPIALDFDFGPDPERRVLITFAPDTELYQSGNEPRLILRALNALGTAEITWSLTENTSLEQMDPEAPYLAWEITLQTASQISKIEEVFEFVDGICHYQITEIDGTDHEDPASSVTLGPESVDDTPPPVVKQTAPTAIQAPAPAPNAQKSTVRVDLDRIDRLVNLVGELVINQSMLSQSVVEAGVASHTAVASGLEEFLQLTRDIQDSVMMIRAQPVKSLFQRMGRIVREASADVGKSVRLDVIGEHTEIDKTVIERLADPLTHMIRNSIDHGIESSEQRRASGKDETGVVTLSASHRSGRVLIEVSDDGGGINREKVREIAEKKGLVSPDQVLSDAETDGLLFLPGFSTADQVSNLSGRGVGMDVVKSSIASLGGRISIASTPGHGTKLSISLPLTLAVLDGMVIRSETETLVVPLGAISETLTLRREDIRPYGPDAQLLRVRDTLVPLMDLAAQLGYRPPLKDFEGSIGLLIGLEDGTQAALVVDAIEDQRQVVIKGLEQSYGSVPGIAAATILGDGQIALILDPGDLIHRAAKQTPPATPTPLEGAA